MTALGTILLAQGQLRQNFAENVSRHTCMFADAATQAMLCFVADPSSKLSATYCQNRYPSPSMRSGLSRVRPRRFWGRLGFGPASYFAWTDCGRDSTRSYELSSAAELAKPAVTGAFVTKTDSVRAVAHDRLPYRTMRACALVVLFVLPTAGRGRQALT